MNINTNIAKWLFFSFDGRIDRHIFWCYIILPLLVVSILNGLAFTYFEEINFSGGMYSSKIISFILLLIQVSGHVKRLHDHDLSAWWVGVILIPIFGILVAFLFSGFLKGNEKTNKYGKPAKEQLKARYDA